MLTLIQQKYQLNNKLKQILQKNNLQKRNEFQITIDEVIVVEILKRMTNFVIT
jgi:hypothetical protein